MVSIQSAVTIIPIEKNKDYTNRDDYKKQISILHCIRTNPIEIEITPLNGETIKFPVGSFVKGALYPICIKEIKYSDYDELLFVGYINN